jgi:ABC-type multidrug transport system fused ATPase/permease subunit
MPLLSASIFTLRSLVSTYGWKILITYVLFILETLLEVFRPAIFGQAIDNLVQQSSMIGLKLFAVLHISHLTVGTIRRMYDTRTFTSIYTELATSVVIDQHQRGFKVSQIAARSYLSQEFVDFFERDIIDVLQLVFGTVGSLVMLSRYDIQYSLYCVLLFIPVILLNTLYSRKTAHFNEQLNDELERTIEIIEQPDQVNVHNHYQFLAQWRICLSDWASINFGFTEIFVLGLLVATLFRAGSRPNIAVGEIYAIFSYAWAFIESLGSIPFLIEGLTKLNDISRRIQSEENFEDEVSVE